MNKMTRWDFWGITTIGLGGMALGSAWTAQGRATDLANSVVATANARSVQRAFRNPPNAYKPMVRWWWPGNDVEDSELQREIRELGGAEIQSFTINLMKPDVPSVPEGDLHGGRRVMLDLGGVKDVAEIKVNGQPGPTLLMQPYIANITRLVHAGRNALEIAVVNAPSNAASPRPPIIPTRGWANHHPYAPRPAGLIGPVALKIGG